MAYAMQVEACTSGRHPMRHRPVLESCHLHLVRMQWISLSYKYCLLRNAHISVLAEAAVSR